MSGIMVRSAQRAGTSGRERVDDERYWRLSYIRTREMSTYYRMAETITASNQTLPLIRSGSLTAPRRSSIKELEVPTYRMILLTAFSQGSCFGTS